MRVMRKIYSGLKILHQLAMNYLIDFLKFSIYSSVFIKGSEKRIEANITYLYHGIEKGLSMPNLRMNFGKDKVESLLELTKLYIKSTYNTELTQFRTACTVLCNYFELHKKNDVNIDDFFTKYDYLQILPFKIPNYNGATQLNSTTYFNSSQADFFEFSKSRHSVRNFNGQLVDNSFVEKAIDIAKTAPSVCNRQAIEVKLINDYSIVQSLLQIQTGILATAETINQVLVITFNRNYFFWIGERNQGFLDGGIFIQNLLYGLHYYNIATCPLHWSLGYKQDTKAAKILRLKAGEKIIVLIAIGYPDEEFKVATSNRRSTKEILTII